MKGVRLLVIENFPIVGLTAPAILGLAVLMMLTGRIVPRSTLRDKEVEIQRWQLAYETEREARIVSDNQTAKLLVAVETNRDVLYALLQVLNKETGAGGAPHVAEEIKAAES